MSLIRLIKQASPTTNPPAGRVFMWVDATWPYSLDETGTKVYLGVTPPSAPTNVYGSEFHLFEQNAPITALAKTQAINWVTWVLPIWKYKITVSYNFNNIDRKTNFIWYFNFWGNWMWTWWDDIIHIDEEYSKRYIWTGPSGDNQRKAFTKTFFVDVITPATQSVLLEFAPETPQDVSIWNANIEVIRVS